MPTDTEPPGQAATAHLKHGPVNKRFDQSLAMHLPPAWFASLDLRVQMFPPSSSCLLQSRDNTVPGRKPLGLVSDVENAFCMQSSSCKVSRQQQRICLIALIRPVKENSKRTKRTFAKMSYESLRHGHCLPCAKIPLPTVLGNICRITGVLSCLFLGNGNFAFDSQDSHAAEGFFRNKTHPPFQPAKRWAPRAF